MEGFPLFSRFNFIFTCNLVGLLNFCLLIVPPLNNILATIVSKIKPLMHRYTSGAFSIKRIVSKPVSFVVFQWPSMMCACYCWDQMKSIFLPCLQTWLREAIEMGNTTSEYEAVHGLLKNRPGVDQKPSDVDKSFVGCVPTDMVGSGNAFLSDKTVQMINAIKTRASTNGNIFSAAHQSSSLQKSRNFKYHTRTMRQFLSNWNINDLFALVEEYENLNTLKSFVLLSNKARQYASTCRNDLANLIDNKLLTDVQLVYEIFTPDGQKVQMGPPIQCHKAILAARSEYFRQLFLRYETTHSFYISSQVDPNVSYEMFIHFIRYLYSNTHDPKVLSTYYLNFLLSKFKCTRNFKEALNYLRFSDCHFSDSVLLFKSSNPTQQDVPVPLIYQCHKSVLCARSKFFSNYLKRKTLHKESDSSSSSNMQSLQSLQNGSDTLTKDSGDNKEFNGATQIVLDTEIVNPKYGRILMDSLYLDTIDLRNITNISMGNSAAASETEDSQTIKSSGVITDAMDLYVIAGLLDIPVLAQGLWLNHLNNLVLKWIFKKTEPKLSFRYIKKNVSEFDFLYHVFSRRFTVVKIPTTTVAFLSDSRLILKRSIFKRVCTLHSYGRVGYD